MRDALYEFAALLGGKLNVASAARLGDALGRAMWRVLPSRRALAASAIAERLGVEPDEAVCLARESFRHNARSFIEIMLTRRMDLRFIRERLTFADPERVRFLAETPRPVVFATAHLGAWELQAGSLNVYPGKRKVIVVRRPKDRALHEVMTRLRTRPRVDVVPHRQAVMPVLRTLRKGGMAAFLVDHNCTRDEAIFLPFLGRLAAVNVGPALLAVRAGALVVPGFLVRSPGNGYVQYFDEPLDTETLQGDRDARIAATAAFYTEAVERYVRRFPEQWFWMHRRWKTRPPEEDAPSTS